MKFEGQGQKSVYDNVAEVVGATSSTDFSVAEKTYFVGRTRSCIYVYQRES